jgi:hypothetical protein
VQCRGRDPKKKKKEREGYSVPGTWDVSATGNRDLNLHIYGVGHCLIQDTGESGACATRKEEEKKHKKRKEKWE